MSDGAETVLISSMPDTGDARAWFVNFTNSTFARRAARPR